MEISKICCIGGLCESFLFADIFQKRVHSPVDGVASRNFRSLLDLFNGKLFDAILSDNILKSEFNPYRQYYSSDEDFLKTHDDFNLRYYCENNNDWSWRSGHTNFELQNRKEEFKRRIELFNDFANDVKNNDDHYYLYAISEYEDSLTEHDFEFTINNLPDYVIDNLIILGAKRNPILDMFDNNFRCVIFNLNLSDHNKVNSLWQK